jgi:hypothetical protein
MIVVPSYPAERFLQLGYTNPRCKSANKSKKLNIRYQKTQKFHADFKSVEKVLQNFLIKKLIAKA